MGYHRRTNEFRCQTRYLRPNVECGGMTTGSVRLLDLVLDRFDEFLDVDALQFLVDEYGRRQAGYDVRQQQLMDRIHDIEAKLERFNEKVLAGDMTEERYDSLTRTAEVQLGQLRSELTEPQALGDFSDLMPLGGRAGAVMRGLVARGRTEEVRDLLGRVFDVVVVGPAGGARGFNAERYDLVLRPELDELETWMRCAAA